MQQRLNELLKSAAVILFLTYICYINYDLHKCKQQKKLL